MAFAAIPLTIVCANMVVGMDNARTARRLGLMSPPAAAPRPRVPAAEEASSKAMAVEIAERLIASFPPRVAQEHVVIPSVAPLGGFVRTACA